MNIIYAGSPEASKETLSILFNSQSEYGFNIVGVLSNMDTAKGRHKELTPTPVSLFAEQNNIPVIKAEHLDSSVREQIVPLKPDLLISFAFGRIFGPKFLAMFNLGGINLHPSLLPKYRGCTPIPACILNGDTETAVTIQTISLKMDEGDILAQKLIKLNGTETTDSLLQDASKIGAELILDIIKDAKLNGKLKKGLSQNKDSSYTKVITKEDAKIDWSKDATYIDAHIRAYTSNPGAWTQDNQLMIKILKAKVVLEENINQPVPKNLQNGTVFAFDKQNGILVKTGKGILSLLELQKQGKKNMNYKDFMNGARDFIGTVLQ